MPRLILLVPVLCLISATRAAEPARLTFEDADVRLRHVFFLAKETNDTSTVDRVLEIRDAVKRSFVRKDLAAAERLIRDAEEVVDLDRGGKTMNGLPVAHANAALQKTLDVIDDKLVAAVQKQDSAGVAATMSELAAALGEQAGVPDVRQKGERTKASRVEPADVADIFLKAVQSDPRLYKFLVSGTPGAETLPRAYAAIVVSCVRIRPMVEKYHKDRLPILDDLVRGCCKAMLALQLEAGYFRLPDVRGKFLLIGEAIDALVEKDPAAIKDGWIVAPIADGTTLVDAAECGMALLEASKLYANAEWKKAGQKAADWTLTAASVKSAHRNAAAISLLCVANRILGERKYADVAWSKFQVGVGPGQAANGRWIVPFEARTPHHFVLLRSLHDLIESLPVGTDRQRLLEASQKAVKAVLDEVETLGVPLTSNTVQELARHLRLFPDAPVAVRALLEQAASASVEKCKAGGKVRAAVPLPELAAAASVWAK